VWIAYTSAGEVRASSPICGSADAVVNTEDQVCGGKTIEAKDLGPRKGLGAVLRHDERLECIRAGNGLVLGR